MGDKIISFPLRSHQPLTEELLSEWKAGLESKDHNEQWRTFERMSNLADIHVLHLCQDFLSLDTGDDLLKTKLLQALKRTCPSSLSFQITKRNKTKRITLADVPLQLEDWGNSLIRPVHLLEEQAATDPTLVQLATELWVYFLEKNYPFYPSILTAKEWSAGLHIYTLAVMDNQLAQEKLLRELPEQYDLAPEELLKCYRRLASFL